MLGKGMKIVDVGGDGNCLFRSIAHQAYGDEEQHRVVRVKCMQYILTEKEYFKSFIEGGKVDEYVETKKQDGKWGDNIEIQAMSEIYDRSVEIYAYDSKPMNIFHEKQNKESRTPFRLAYHGKSHYNSIISKNWNSNYKFIKDKEPGVSEQEAIDWSKTQNEIPQIAPN